MKEPIVRAALAAAALWACGCSEQLNFTDVVNETHSEITFTFSVGEQPAVLSKSSVYDGEKISDINLFVWRDGDCVSHEYVGTETGRIRIPLVTGTKYSFYVLANCGGSIEPASAGWRKDESSMEGLEIGFPDAGQETRPLPMAAVLKDRAVDVDSPEVEIELVRLVSRIVFEYSPDTALSGSGISVTGVRLRDAAQHMAPFAGRNQASEEDVADGDFSSETDLQSVNAGGQIVFYAFENCWGDLLAGNTDQKKKIPEEFGNVKGPTYIETSCAFGGSGLLGGSMTYRIYLGADATGNFDLVRNSSYRIQLSGSKDGLEEVSWRIDKDVSFNDYLAEWELTKSAHEASGLYLGEMFTGALKSFDPSLVSYFGENFLEMEGRFTIRCFAPDKSAGEPESDPIVFDAVKAGNDGRFTFTATCRDELSDGELWICDTVGRKISKVADGINVRLPKLVFSSDTMSDRPDEEQKNPVAVINGKAADVCAYLCDDNGRNMLAGDGKGYGFAADVFNFRILDDSRNWTAVKEAGGLNITAPYRCSGRTGNLRGQPFCRIRLKVSNTGDAAAVNSELWKMVGSSGCLNVGIVDRTHTIIGTKAFDVSYIPLEICMYDREFGGKDAAAAYGIKSQFFFTVSNPSGMSFNFRYLVLAKRGSTTPRLGLPTPAGTSIMFFDCPPSVSLPPSLYMYSAEAIITSNSTGSFTSCTKTVADDGTVIIGLNRTFEDLLYATRTAEAKFSYDEYGYYDPAFNTASYDSYCFNIKDGLNIMMDFSSCTDGKLDFSLGIELEDGSSKCDYIYNNDYSIRYFGVLSANSYINTDQSGKLYPNYPYITPLNMAKLMKRKRDISVYMVDSASPYYALKTDNVITNTYIKPTLICRGFCRTHVNGQKKDPVDYTMEERYAPEITSKITYPTNASNITRAGISTLFGRIFNKTYDDSDKKYFKGTPWPHHAHPTKVTLDLFFQRDDYAGNWYVYHFQPYSPVSLSYDNSGYSAQYDSNPYTVVTAVDWKTTHNAFSHKIITVE